MIKLALKTKNPKSVTLGQTRSTVAPFIEGVATTGKKVAKDGRGRNIEIPATMTYEDYESVYIGKEKSLSTWKKEHPEPKVEYKILAAI